MGSIEERYKLCKNCTERVAAGKCAGKCKEYWKALGAKEQRAIDEKGKDELLKMVRITILDALLEVCPNQDIDRIIYVADTKFAKAMEEMEE